jgi:hypothetical protein
MCHSSRGERVGEREKLLTYPQQSSAFSRSREIPQGRFEPLCFLAKDSKPSDEIDAAEKDWLEGRRGIEQSQERVELCEACWSVTADGGG